ncbi:unnamed protein product [Larinioides sclopetarius]|uniref:Granulin n=1 Tax=Larinioides sclopetarius TaxID=280406 RepID=A0AAV2B5T8_9ARAC
MITILVFFVIPCLAAAEVPCPDNKVTCPQDKRCCELEGRYTCCDSDDVHFLEIKVKVRAGTDVTNASPYPNMSVSAIQAGPFDTCTRQNCYGECCSSNACCPYIAADCCSETSCCPSLHSCCPGERCCPMGKKCCRELCCEIDEQCCPGGCCDLFAECCGTGCCASGTQCCGSWCCLQAQRCGESKHECHDAAHTNTPSVLGGLMLIGLIFVSHRV